MNFCTHTRLDYFKVDYILMTGKSKDKYRCNLQDTHPVIVCPFDVGPFDPAANWHPFRPNKGVSNILLFLKNKTV